MYPKNPQSTQMLLVFFTVWALLAKLVAGKDLQVYWDCKDVTGPNNSKLDICASNLKMTFEFLNGTKSITDNGQIFIDDFELAPCLVNNQTIKLSLDPRDEILRIPFSEKRPAQQKVCDNQFRINFFPTVSLYSDENNQTGKIFQGVANCLATNLQTPKCELSFKSNEQQALELLPKVLIGLGSSCGALYLLLTIGCMLKKCKRSGERSLLLNEKHENKVIPQSETATPGPSKV